jgi:hypothetical protein
MTLYVAIYNFLSAIHPNSLQIGKSIVFERNFIGAHDTIALSILGGVATQSNTFG